MHEKLALVVVGATAGDCVFAGVGIFGDNGLEGIRTPFLKRLRRLNIVMAVNQNSLVSRVQNLLSKDYRIA